MNQILGNQFIDKNSDIDYSNNFLKFKTIFYFSIIIIFLCIVLLFFIKYYSYKNNKISKKITDSLKIQNLYSENSIYSAQRTITNTNIDNSSPFVIGLLKIDKINLTYPILSTISDDLLKIAPCRFYGPMPNEVGNLCIAGHNYANQTHFGKLTALKNGDIIEIYDLNNKKIEYIIYEIKEVPPEETSCMSQNTNGFRELTLITCNTLKNSRIIIKAKENKL